MIDGARQIARSCGYALGVHGSQVRDLDLIACPWVEWAIDPYRLVDALLVALEWHVSYTPESWPRRGDTKPHGRLGWILVAFPEYREGRRHLPPRMIDLSVMPRWP